MGTGLSEVGSVKSLNLVVFMGEADRIFLIHLIQSFAPVCSLFPAVVDRLASSSCTAAGAAMV